MDRYYAYLRVLETSPIYRDKDEKGRILEYMKDRFDMDIIFSSLLHHGFSKSFLLWEIYKDQKSVRNKIEQSFENQVFSESVYYFLNKEFIIQINKDQGIITRDPLVKAFIYPTFKSYWLSEIDTMGTKESDGSGEKIYEQSEQSGAIDNLESTRYDVEKTLEEILDQENNNKSNLKNANINNLQTYGVSKDYITIM